MLKLFINPNKQEQRELKDCMEEMVLSHRVIQVTQENGHLSELPENAHLPVLKDGDRIFQNREEILEHLEQMERFKQEWDKFQSDACYCDDEGEIE